MAQIIGLQIGVWFFAIVYDTSRPDRVYLVRFLTSIFGDFWDGFGNKLFALVKSMIVEFLTCLFWAFVSWQLGVYCLSAISFIS